MKKSRFTESQIVAVLRKAEQGQKISDLCRELGISEATFYSWRSKYGGMQVNELKRVKELEDENARLKRMYADLSLVNDALKQVLEPACRQAGKSTGACRTQSRCRVDWFRLGLASNC
jgi:putative transposase